MLGKTVAELDRGMSAREFAEWFEYYKLEPFGDDWLQASTIAATQAQVWSKQRISPDAFIPRVKAQDDFATLKAKLTHFAHMHNTADERRRNKKKP